MAMVVTAGVAFFKWIISRHSLQLARDRLFASLPLQADAQHTPRFQSSHSKTAIKTSSTQHAQRQTYARALKLSLPTADKDGQKNQAEMLSVEAAGSMLYTSSEQLVNTVNTDPRRQQRNKNYSRKKKHTTEITYTKKRCRWSTSSLPSCFLHVDLRMSAVHRAPINPTRAAG